MHGFPDDFFLNCLTEELRKEKELAVAMRQMCPSVAGYIFSICTYI